MYSSFVATHCIVSEHTTCNYVIIPLKCLRGFPFVDHNTAMFSRRVVLRALRPCSRRPSSTKAPSVATTSPQSTPAENTLTGIAPQAPNYPTPWSTNQRPRPAARSGPRFEQTVMDLQPNPLSAMELIASEPARFVQGRKAVCDGGGGPLGHPKIFINLDKPGPHACGYCGIQFEQAVHHGHEH